MTAAAPSALLAGAAVVAVGALLRALPAPPARVLPEGRHQPGDTRARSARSAARRFADRLVGSWWSRRRDHEARRAAWPSVADEVGAGLRSGASLRQALEAAANRGGAAGETLRAVLVPVARGDPLGRAAGRWAQAAAGEPDEALLADAVGLAATAARADPMLFDVVADTIRDRAAVAGELRAQTAQARASALALSVLPLGFTGLLALADPGVLAFLLGTPGGWLCLTLGITLQAAGGWWMHRMVSEVGR